MIVPARGPITLLLLEHGQFHVLEHVVVNSIADFFFCHDIT